MPFDGGWWQEGNHQQFNRYFPLFLRGFGNKTRRTLWKYPHLREPSCDCYYVR